MARTFKQALVVIREKFKTIEKKTRSRKNMNIAGKMLRTSVYERTKSGKGVREAKGKPYKLAPLSKSYKDFRNGKVRFVTLKNGRVIPILPDRKISKKTGKKLKGRGKFEKPKLGPEGKPNKSNLTFSGKMLEQLKYKIKRGSIILTFKSKKSRQKAEWAHEGSDNRPKREFLHGSNADYKMLTLFFRKKMREVLVKLFR